MMGRVLVLSDIHISIKTFWFECRYKIGCKKNDC